MLFRSPPGATPPVGSEPAKHLDASLNQQAHGRQDLIDSEEGHEVDDTDYKQRVARQAAKLAPQMMQANPGAHFQHYEEVEKEEEVVAEAKDMDDADDKMAKKKAKKMKKMMKKSLD